jgi:hypothetical protein
MAIITRQLIYALFADKLDEIKNGAIAGIRTRVAGLGSLHHNP